MVSNYDVFYHNPSSVIFINAHTKLSLHIVTIAEYRLKRV